MAAASRPAVARSRNGGRREGEKGAAIRPSEHARGFFETGPSGETEVAESLARPRKRRRIASSGSAAAPPLSARVASLLRLSQSPLIYPQDLVPRYRVCRDELEAILRARGAPDRGAAATFDVGDLRVRAPLQVVREAVDRRMQDPRAELRDEEPAALQMPSFEALTRVVARLRKRLEGERAVSRPRTEYNTRSPSLIAEHIRRVESLGDGGAQMLREDEVLLRVAIYHPTKGYRTQELVVTGTQTLANLRDAICCSVVLGLGEWRDSAVDPVAAASAQEARSGGPRELSFRVVDSAAFRVCSDFFFIEGVAFEDVRGTRHSAAQQLREWLCGSARSKEPRFMEPGLCDFAVEPMDRHSLEELRLRVGAQYLYQHAGGCNHVLVFTEATVGAPRDSRCRAAYPLPLFEAKVHMHACDMCSVSVAALVVHMDEFAAKSPAFFCDACFRLFNRGRAAPPRQLLFKPASEGGLAPVDGFSA